MNTAVQNYKGIPLQLIEREDYADKKAKAFAVNQTKYMIWIPNKHLEEDGTLKEVDLEYVFIGELRKLEQAGVILSYDVMKSDNTLIEMAKEAVKAVEATESQDRVRALEELLQPITWFRNAGIAYKRKVVMQRRDAVHNAYPFMNESEKQKADEWLKTEKHEELFF